MVTKKRMSYKGWDPDLISSNFYYILPMEDRESSATSKSPIFIWTLKLKIYKTCNFNCKAKLYHKRSKEQNDLFIA